MHVTLQILYLEKVILLYLNEGVDRVKQVIKECRGMTYLISPTQIPIILPSEYHSLLATFSTARCFSQDESNYRAGLFMNEFETKLQELKEAIDAGEYDLLDGSGNPVETVYYEEYVDLTDYWTTSTTDLDDGVESVE